MSDPVVGGINKAVKSWFFHDPNDTAVPYPDCDCQTCQPVRAGGGAMKRKRWVIWEEQDKPLVLTVRRGSLEFTVEGELAKKIIGLLELEYLYEAEEVVSAEAVQ